MVEFNRGSPAGIAIVEWWQSLDNLRGDRAMLSRYDHPAAIVLTPAYHRAHARIAPHVPVGGAGDSRLPVIVGTLSQVRIDRPDTLGFAHQMAANKNDRSIVSELRFRRLIQTEDRATLMQHLIRIIRMMEGRAADALSIAESIYYWGPRTRERWAFTYFGNVPNKS